MNQSLVPFLWVLGIASLLMAVFSILVTVARPFAKRRTILGPGTAIFCYIATAIQLLIFFIALMLCMGLGPQNTNIPIGTS